MLRHWFDLQALQFLRNSFVDMMRFAGCCLEPQYAEAWSRFINVEANFKYRSAIFDYFRKRLLFVRSSVYDKMSSSRTTGADVGLLLVRLGTRQRRVHVKVRRAGMELASLA